MDCPKCLRANFPHVNVCNYCGSDLGNKPEAGSEEDSRAAPGSAADVESEVCEDIKARQRRGIAKYGTTVAANPLSQREWLTHAYEEALDLAVYLKRIIDGTQPPNVAISCEGGHSK